MYKNVFLTANLWNLYHASAFSAWGAISECVLWMFSLWGLLRMLHGIAVWEIGNTRMLLIQSPL